MCFNTTDFLLPLIFRKTLHRYDNDNHLLVLLDVCGSLGES